MSLIPRELRPYFWGVLFAILALALWWLAALLAVEAVNRGLFPSVLIDSETLTLGGFVSHLLQLGAFFAAIRMLMPSRPIRAEMGRPIFVVNLDKTSESAPYGECNELREFEELHNAPASNGDRTLACYKDTTGNIEVIDELSSWGQKKATLVAAVHPAVGGVQPPTRWVSEWAADRRSFGCPTEKGNQYLMEPIKRGRLESLMWSFRERYNYCPETEWGERKSQRYAMAYWNDDRYTSCSLCEYFESKCPSEFEKTKVMWGLRSASKTINIIRLRNITHEVINDIHVHIGGKGARSGKVIKKVADVENMDIVINTFAYAQIIARSLPPQASRFLVVETVGAPLRSGDFHVETKLVSKFGVKALRWIAILSFSITLLVAAISSAHSNMPNKAIQSTPKVGATDGAR